jgi:hypothetical protein
MSHPKGAHYSIPVERIDRLEERLLTAQCRFHTAIEDTRIAWMLLENVMVEVQQLRPDGKRPLVVSTQAA